MFTDKKIIETEKKLIDREIAVYRTEKFLEIDRNAQDRKEEMWVALNELRVDSINDNKQLEHDFHSGKELKNVELAKLDAQIEFKKEQLIKIKNYEDIRESCDKWQAKAEAAAEIIKSKESQIKLLDDIVKVVVGKLSKIDVGSLGINVNTDKK